MVWQAPAPVPAALMLIVRVRNKIRLCSEVDESEEPRPRRFVWDCGEARTARTLVGAHGIHRLRLRLSPLWLCSMSGRAPRPCSLRQLVVSALAQETECLRWSPWARFPLRLSTLVALEWTSQESVDTSASSSGSFKFLRTYAA